MNFQKGWDYVIHLCVLGTYTTNSCGINGSVVVLFCFCFLVYLLCQVQAISIKLTFVHQMSVFFSLIWYLST